MEQEAKRPGREDKLYLPCLDISLSTRDEDLRYKCSELVMEWDRKNRRRAGSEACFMCISYYVQQKSACNLVSG